MEILKSVGRVSRTGGLIFILVSAVTGSLVCTGAASAQSLTTLTSFNVNNGAYSRAGLIADANGNLFGTTYSGGAYGYGTVYEITNSSGVYNGTPIILASFDFSHGANPFAGLIADANGNLLGTTSSGGAYGYGTVFEITNNSGVYGGTPIVLASFDSSDGAFPFAGLLADANGNLFGTTSSGGAYGNGTVFEITNNSGVYGGTPIALASFNGSDGAFPVAGLIADANGNLFGTTYIGGAYGYGTVFEITNSSGVYADTPIALASFDNSDGAYPYDSLIADAHGNLFGTTNSGGAYGDGTVFEITNSSGVYASTPTPLASFNGSDGGHPYAGLIADADGNLFGTTYAGGAYGYGTVFEIANSSGVYAPPVALVSFNGSDGALPYAGLIADAKGNLFGTTLSGGAEGFGSVFEVTGSGFVPPKKFAGTPGAANCTGLSVSAMAHTYGGTAHAAAALGYASVKDLQSAVASYCGS